MVLSGIYTKIKEIYIKQPQNSFNSEQEAMCSLVAGLALCIIGQTNDLQLAGALFLSGCGSRKKAITNIALTVLSIACVKKIYSSRAEILKKVKQLTLK